MEGVNLSKLIRKPAQSKSTWQSSWRLYTFGETEPGVGLILTLPTFHLDPLNLTNSFTYRTCNKLELELA